MAVNYLAHALLSQRDPGALIGNLAGDHVKGPLDLHSLHPRVAAGVLRHRRVDVITDSHPVYRSAITNFPAGERRFASIALDIAFDRYLVRHWHRVCSDPIRVFRQRVYRVIREYPGLLPPAFAIVAPRWADADWLSAYDTLDGVRAVLEHIALKRLQSLPAGALIETLTREESTLEAAFLRVFTDVRSQLGSG